MRRDLSVKETGKGPWKGGLGCEAGPGRAVRRLWGNSALVLFLHPAGPPELCFRLLSVRVDACILQSPDWFSSSGMLWVTVSRDSPAFPSWSPSSSSIIQPHISPCYLERT